MFRPFTGAEYENTTFRRAGHMVRGTGFAGGDTVFGNHLSDTQMADVFTTAMSKGLNLWDTAAVYGMGVPRPRWEH